MCGLYASFSVPRQKNTLFNLLNHRGPDHFGFLELKNNVILAHSRLSIQDLNTRSNQPFRYKNLTLLFNGEIYNHGIIRTLLTAQGYSFNTESDTETIIKAYDYYGPACFDMFDGMFSICIYCTASRQFIFARDRCGEKPLHYVYTDNSLEISSEISALNCESFFLSELSIAHYFTYGYFPRESTANSRVLKAFPGYYYIYDCESGSLSSNLYWQLPELHSQNSNLSISNALESIDDCLYNSVRSRLLSDVPVAVLLSGGIDSGLISAYASSIQPNIEAFTVRFEDSRFDESPLASLIANHLKIPHTIVDASPPSFADLCKLLRHLDEPFADTSIIPTALVSEAISSKYKVALSGDGGDELFCGYTHYKWLNKQRLFRKFIPSSVRSILSSLALLATGPGKRGFNFLSGLKGSLSSAFYCANRFYTPSELSHLSHKFVDCIPHLDKSNAFSGFQTDIVSKAMKTDFLTYLPNDILTKTDRSSMLYGLELRSPFLSRELIELAYTSLSSSINLSNNSTKYLLRKLASKYLPTDVIKTKKQGFCIPLDHWMTNYWRVDIISFFESYDPIFLSREYILSLVDSWNSSGLRSSSIFCLFSYCYWESLHKNEIL